MADQERADAYNAALRKAMKAWADADLKMAADVRASIVKYRDAAVATMANDGTEWDAKQRRQTVARLNDALAVMDRDMGAAFNDAMDAAVEATIMGVDNPLTAFGVNVAQYRPVLPLDQIALIKSVAPSMITDVTTQVHQKVQGELLRFSLGGGGSRQQVIERIGNLVGPIGSGELKEGQIIPRAEVRARNILRQEMNRVSNITSTTRIDDLAKRDAGFGKKWLHYYSPEPRAAHEALHGKVIYPAKGEKFDVNGTLADGPHDPVLPASESMGCRCKLAAHYDPSQSEIKADPLVAAAPSGGGAPAATPAGAPKPAKTAIDKPKPAAKAKPKVKPAAGAPADTGPVTVAPAGPASGSKIPKPAKVKPAAAAKPAPKAPIDDDGPVTVSAPVAKAKAKKAAREAVDSGRFTTRSGTDGGKFYSQHADAQNAVLSEADNRHIVRYQHESQAINRRQRRHQKFIDGQVDSEYEYSPIDDVRTGMEKAISRAAPLDDDVVVWRGMGSRWPGVTDAVDKSGMADEILSLQHVPDEIVGTVIRDGGFMSTSVNEAVASTFGNETGVIFRIEAPKGSRAVWGIDPEHEDQRELIFAPNTKLRVLKIERDVAMETKDSYFGESSFGKRTVVHVRIEV